MNWLAGAATIVLLVAVWATWLWNSRRFPGRDTRRRARYICERFAQRVRDWWAYVKARL